MMVPSSSVLVYVPVTLQVWLTVAGLFAVAALSARVPQARKLVLAAVLAGVTASAAVAATPTLPPLPAAPSLLPQPLPGPRPVIDCDALWWTLECWLMKP